MKALAKSVVVACGLALAACETGVEVPVSLPAQYQAASDLRTIAVLDFQGRDGGGFADALEATLTSATYNGAAYFNVINRQTMQSKSGASGPSDRAVAAAIAYGSQIGVEGVYFGSVIGMDVETTSSQQERSKCVEWDGPFDCERRQNYTTTCYNLNAVYTVSPSLANVRTGSVAYSDTVTGESSGYYCQEDTNKPTRDSLLAEARADVLVQIRNAVAPRNTMARVDLEEQASLGNANDQAEFDGAVAFAKEGRLDRACGTWDFLSDKYPDVYEVLFNKGVCAEVSGDFAGAFEVYSQLDAALVSPKPKLSEALQRVERQLSANRLIRN